MEGERIIIEALSRLTDIEPSFEPKTFQTLLCGPDISTVIFSDYDDGDSDNYGAIRFGCSRILNMCQLALS
jgi:hypothetical protein